MIKGEINSGIQSELSYENLIDYEVLEINYLKKEIILLNGIKKYKCKILKENIKNQTYVIKINGHISSIRLMKSVEKTIEKIGINKNSLQNVNVIKAPMPGLILEVMFKVGDKVKKGDPIIVLEAMKMENILTAPVDAVIKEIKVKPQQTVEKNNVLINFII